MIDRAILASVVTHLIKESGIEQLEYSYEYADEGHEEGFVRNREVEIVLDEETDSTLTFTVNAKCYLHRDYGDRHTPPSTENQNENIDIEEISLFWEGEEVELTREEDAEIERTILDNLEIL